MSAVDYQAVKARCNANWTPECTTYFLTLPRGDLGVQQSRSDFAGDYCRDPNHSTTVPCNLLCRDDKATCLANRRRWCEGVTLEMVEAGQRPECACYLSQSEYKRHIARIRNILGDTTANQLEAAINSPYCFYGPCATSENGLASRTGGCQSLSGCLQSVEVNSDNGNHTVVSNVCNIVTSTTPLPSPGNPATPLPPPSGNPPVIIPPTTDYSWVWWVILVAVILLLILIGFFIYRSRRSKNTGLTPLQLALLSQT
jgi:hypothetical protein